MHIKGWPSSVGVNNVLFKYYYFFSFFPLADKANSIATATPEPNL